MQVFDPVWWMVAKLPTPFQSVVPITGAILLMFTLGNTYTFGNLMPYLLSYEVEHVNPYLTVGTMTWVHTSSTIPFSYLIGAALLNRIGSRPTVMLGCMLCTGSVLLTYFTIKISFGVFYLTYGLLAAFGGSIVYSTSVSTTVKWQPGRNCGLAVGLVEAGYGLSSLLFSQVQTLFINPNKYTPNKDGLFTQDDLLDRVPYVFLLLGIIFAATHLVGCALLIEPKPRSAKSEARIKKEISEKDALLSLEDEPCVPDRSLSPVDALKTSTFWWLFFTFFFTTPVNNTVTSYYKTFGQKFIFDDYFLATIGSIAAIGNAAGRLIWGAFGDRYSYQLAMCITTSLISALMFTMPLTKYLGAYGLLIWVTLLFLCITATYPLMPFAARHAFGERHFALNYAWLFVSPAFAGPLTTVVSDFILRRWGYTTMWFIAGSCGVIAFILSATIHLTKYGQHDQAAHGRISHALRGYSVADFNRR